VTQLAVFFHIVAAILLVGGTISVTMLAVAARAAPDLERRRAIVMLSKPFERMTTVAVPTAIVTGLVTLVLFGYSITSIWVLATGVVLLVMVAIQVLHWNKMGPRVHEALERGDDAAAVELMQDPRSVMLGRVEVGLSFLTVALMVFRPG
jgi:uncharacterized membrane protein